MGRTTVLVALSTFVLSYALNDGREFSSSTGKRHSDYMAVLSQEAGLPQSTPSLRKRSHKDAAANMRMAAQSVSVGTNLGEGHVPMGMPMEVQAGMNMFVGSNPAFWPLNGGVQPLMGDSAVRSALTRPDASANAPVATARSEMIPSVSIGVGTSSVPSATVDHRKQTEQVVAETSGSSGSNGVGGEEGEDVVDQFSDEMLATQPSVDTQVVHPLDPELELLLARGHAQTRNSIAEDIHKRISGHSFSRAKHDLDTMLETALGHVQHIQSLYEDGAQDKKFPDGSIDSMLYSVDSIDHLLNNAWHKSDAVQIWDKSFGQAKLDSESARDSLRETLKAVKKLKSMREELSNNQTTSLMERVNITVRSQMALDMMDVAKFKLKAQREMDRRQRELDTAKSLVNIEGGADEVIHDSIVNFTESRYGRRVDALQQLLKIHEAAEKHRYDTQLQLANMTVDLEKGAAKTQLNLMAIRKRAALARHEAQLHMANMSVFAQEKAHEVQMELADIKARAATHAAEKRLVVDNETATMEMKADDAKAALASVKGAAAKEQLDEVVDKLEFQLWVEKRKVDAEQARKNRTALQALFSFEVALNASHKAKKDAENATQAALAALHDAVGTVRDGGDHRVVSWRVKHAKAMLRVAELMYGHLKELRIHLKELRATAERAELEAGLPTTVPLIDSADFAPESEEPDSDHEAAALHNGLLKSRRAVEKAQAKAEQAGEKADMEAAMYKEDGPEAEGRDIVGLTVFGDSDSGGESSTEKKADATVARASERNQALDEAAASFEASQMARKSVESAGEDGTLEFLEEGAQLPLVCDTPYQCKAKVAGNTMSCCKVCTNSLHLEGEDPHYGFYEHLELDPNGKSEEMYPSNRAVSDFQDQQKAKYESLAATNGKRDPALLEELLACPMPANDDFKLPCCQPCTADWPEDDPNDTMPPHPENRQLPLNGEGGHPDGPLLVASEFDQPRETPCCASKPSCCRWCPDKVCSRLEFSNHFLDSLYWHLCRDLDEGERLSRDRLLGQDTHFRDIVNKGTFWDPQE